MSLFGRRKNNATGGAVADDPRLLPPRQVYCQVCQEERRFSRCWLRVRLLTQCTACGQAFENPSKLYNHVNPACPRCGEHLEHRGFEYGQCDVCGSKYEVMEHTKPSLLPNAAQRAEMAKHGIMRYRDR